MKTGRMARKDHHELLRQNTVGSTPPSSSPSSSRDAVNTKPSGQRKFAERKNAVSECFQNPPVMFQNLEDPLV